MEFVFLIGRILFGGYFIISGIAHFTKKEALADYAASRNVLAPRAMVAVSGLFILLGGLGIVFGAYTRIAAILLIIFLVIVSYKMHAFWKVRDSQMRATEMNNFMKNMALAGAALLLLTIENPWPFSIF